MGAINNAFNQAVGAAAGAGLAIKHAKETDFSKAITAEHSALVAKNQASEAETEAKYAKAEEGPTQISLGNALNDNWDKENAYNKIKDDTNVPYRTKMKKLTESEASKKAIAELLNKLDGIEAMQQRAKDQRAYADRASQIASKAQQRYQSKWGGK